MKNNFDPMQETQEEYLRRIHLEDKLTVEWKKHGQEEIFKEKQETDIY